MIYKDLDPFTGGNKYEAAGRKAEEQMAFMLRRFFKDSTDVDVLNGVRIEVQGEIAQMDHLILLPYGLLIVESKSVTGKVQIKDDGQWVRWYDNQSQGMRSPITQAKMQAMLLKELLGQSVRQKGAFDAIPVESLIAISDTGEILWPKSGPLPEVCKADQIPERIQAKAVTGGLLNQENRKKIAEFLRLAHKPIAPTSTPTPEPVPATKNAPVPDLNATVVMVKGSYPEKRCKHCHSIKLEVRYGPYGYYFNCAVCDKNTNLKFTCPECGGEGRIRKEGNEFYAECNACSASKLFFTNL